CLSTGTTNSLWSRRSDKTTCTYCRHCGGTSLCRTRPCAGTQNFATQAVIAIENARLLSELRESLEQQTASADVLGIISSSVGQLKPVFETILANAIRLCDANFGNLFLCDGTTFELAAMLNAPPALAEFLSKRGRFVPTPGIALDRLLNTKQLVH